MKKSINPIIAAVLIGISSLAFAGGPSCDGKEGPRPPKDWSNMSLEQRQTAFIAHHDAMVDKAVENGTLTKADAATLKEANAIVAKKLLPTWNGPKNGHRGGPKTPPQTPAPTSAN